MLCLSDTYFLEFFEDYDDCAGFHRRDHICKPEVEGWFKCECNPGYYLLKDGYTCRGAMNVYILNSLFSTKLKTSTIIHQCPKTALHSY